nr:uncharacterized protein LOC109172465 [Ipomoea trifida]
MSYCTFPTLKILLKNYLGYDGANVENNLPNELEDVIEAAEIARRASTSLIAKPDDDDHSVEMVIEKTRREELFIHGGYYLSRDIFQTLRSGELESMFLDIWCLRLNQLDLNRGIDKPKRMFFSTQTFLQLDSPSDWAKQPDSGKQLDFEQCLDTEIQNVANLDISDAQLIFFTIFRHGYFFLMCFNFNTSIIEIIDNRPLPKGLKMQQKYGDSSKVLKNAFAMYLHKKEHTNLEEKVKKLTVELIKMNWRSADNKTDCGLYYMRHMETYMGNPQWKCGFAPKKPNVAWTAFDVQVFGNQV